MKPNYVAKKSVWSVITIWQILFFWLIIPLIVMIVKIIIIKNEVIEFYDTRVVEKKGVLSKQETQAVLTNVMSVSVYQTVKVRMFNYGDVKVDLVGRWDIDTTGIANPTSLKRHIEKYIQANNLQQVITN